MSATATIDRSGLKNICEPPPEAPVRYAAGRVCSVPGCGTVLTRYNPNTTCYRHDGADYPEDEAIEMIVFGGKICSECGVRKPATMRHFHSDRSTQDGLRSVCRACKKEKDKLRNRELRRAKGLEVLDMVDPAPSIRKVRELMAIKGAKLSQVARACGVSYTTVRSIRHGLVAQVEARTERAILAADASLVGKRKKVAK